MSKASSNFHDSKAAAPAGVIVEEVGRNIHIHLPPRKRSVSLEAAVILSLIIPVFIFCIFWFSVTLGLLPRSHRNWFFAAIGLLPLQFVCSGFKQVFVCAYETSYEIVISPTHLKGVGHAGFLSVVSEMRIDRIPSIAVCHPPMIHQDRDGNSRGNYMSIGERGFAGRRSGVHIAEGYPADLLNELAHFISQQIKRRNPGIAIAIST
jgi:hypothetical protein